MQQVMTVLVEKRTVSSVVDQATSLKTVQMVQVLVVITVKNKVIWLVIVLTLLKLLEQLIVVIPVMKKGTFQKNAHKKEEIVIIVVDLIILQLSAQDQEE